MIATAKGAFGNRWWLYVSIDGSDPHVVRERTPGGGRRTMDFDTAQEAREYFEQFTTPIVEQVA